MERRPLIIDCDTGTDDAIAILAALYSREAEVLALTSVNGNVRQQHVCANNLNLVEYLGFDRVAVAKGAGIPLYPRGDYYGDTHGVTGLGTVVLPKAKRLRYSVDNSVEVIRKAAEEKKGRLELLVTGPMTNIAMTICLYPEIIRQIKHIWFMGGTIYGGNVTAAAEFNIWVDPVAARLVLNSGIPMTMVGLNVTEKAELNRQDEAYLRGLGTKASVLAADIAAYMLERHGAGGEAAFMHDALALAAALEPGCMSYVRCFADVECGGVYTAGHTMVDLKDKLHKEKNVNVAVDLNPKAFKKWLLGAIALSSRPRSLEDGGT